MKLIRSNKKNLLILAGIFLFIAVVIFLVIKSYSANPMPADFIDARREAAVVSEKIVTITESTNQKIKSINISDLRGDSEKALVAVKDARELNGEAQAAAFELARHLQKMAESLAQIKSTSDQGLAYEAVAVELGLVSEFISYTESLNNFLNTLSRAIDSNSEADREQAKNYLSEVNQKVLAINNLNKEFIFKIEELDSRF